MTLHLTVLSFLVAFHKDRVWGHCCLPLLFTIYSSKLFEVIKYNLPEAHTYADDTQLYLSFSPDSATNQIDAVVAMERCISDIRTWMLTDKLKLNDDKTEFMLIETKQQVSKVNIDSLTVGSIDVAPVTVARNLRTWFDSNLNHQEQIHKTCKSGFFHLYNIRCIRKYLSQESVRTLVHAFIIVLIVYSLLFGLPNRRGATNGAVVRALVSHQCGPGSNPGVDAICGLSLLLVLSFAPRGFSSGTPVFPSPQKPTPPNSNSIWNARTRLNEFI